MRHVNSLRKALGLIAAARDITVDTKLYQWEIRAPNTLYLEAEHADIDLLHIGGEHILAQVRMRAALSWKLVTDQDDAGVYIVAKRKPLIGSIGRARFQIEVPDGIHISLKLRNCQLCLRDVDSTFDFPPQRER